MTCRNRERTLPVVKEIDKKMLHDLHLKRLYFLRNSRTSSALRRVAQESYYLHVYHTVAIEGNTMSIGQTRSFFLFFSFVFLSDLQICLGISMLFQYF